MQHRGQWAVWVTARVPCYLLFLVFWHIHPYQKQAILRPRSNCLWCEHFASFVSCWHLYSTAPHCGYPRPGLCVSPRLLKSKLLPSGRWELVFRHRRAQVCCCWSKAKKIAVACLYRGKVYQRCLWKGCWGHGSLPPNHPASKSAHRCRLERPSQHRRAGLLSVAVGSAVQAEAPSFQLKRAVTQG